MSQRGCAGLNWPPLSIPAEDPVSISPEAVSRAGAAANGIWSLMFEQPALSFARVSASSERIGKASMVFGVAQPASHAERPNSALTGTFGHSPPSFQSRVVGIGQPAM